ncbi:putative T7SS-secreted protein [Streptomyces sp. NPDC002644]
MGIGDFISDITPDSVEDAVEDGVEWVGNKVEGAGNWTADRLEDVGWDSGADWVREQSRSVANRMGAEVDEMDLGQSEDKTKLIYGSAEKIRSTAEKLRAFQAAFDNAGEGLRGLDSSKLKGEAAEALRKAVSTQPPKWFTGADACEKAAAALEAFAGTVTWAQGQAQTAIDKWKEGVKASEEAADAHRKKIDDFNAAVDRHNADPDKYPAGGLPPRPSPTFTDPGKKLMQDAQDILADARKQRNTAAETARSAVRAARDTAPEKPSYTAQALSGLQEMQIMGDHVGGGIIKGTAGLVNFVRGINPLDPYNITHPAEYTTNLNNLAAGLVLAANDPVGTGKQMVSDFMKDPYEGFGRLIPDAALAVATGGGGVAVKGVRIAADAADAARLRNLVDDAPDGTHNRPDHARTTDGTDPVDLASGRMFLPQADVELPGILPLRFTRRTESGNPSGRFLGPAWTCTVDERLAIDPVGVVHATPDGLLITYPHPVPGSPTRPESGTARTLLEREGDGDYTLTDPDTGLIRRFTAPYGSEPGEDGTAWLTSLTDRNGHTVTVDRTDDGLPLALVHSDGYHLKLALADGRITALTLAGAGEAGTDLPLMSYGYDEHGNLTTVTKPSGATTTFLYDDRHRVTAWIDSNNSRYDYTYDDHDRVVAEGGEAGHVKITLAYAEPDPGTGHRTTTLTTADGRVTRHLVDRHSRIVATTDPAGSTTRWTYDSHGNVLSRTDPLGRTTAFVHDEDGRLLSTVRPDGSGHTMTPGPFGRYTELVGPDGARWTQEFDERGNRTSVTDPGGGTTRFVHDTRGRLTSVADALGAVTTVRCDSAGLPVRITDPAGGTTLLERDALGSVVRVTDPAGGITCLEWDSDRNLVRRVAPDGSVESWTYDGEGNQLTHTDPVGGVSRCEYTHFDLLAARSGPDGARYAFAYDADLRLVEVTDPQGARWTYEYDAAGRVAAETDFDGRTLRYRFDPTGLLISRTDALGQTIAFERDQLGRVLRKDAAGQVTTYAYDPAGRLLRATGPDSELLCMYDRRGRVKAEVVDGRTMSYAYDVLGRRTRRVTPTGHVTTYGYDAGGRPERLTTGRSSVVFTHDVAGRETARAFGDVEGALTITSAWDEAGRLASEHMRAGGRTLNRRAYTYRPDGYLTAVDDLLAGNRSFDLDAVGQVVGVRAEGWAERYAYDASGNQAEASWPLSHPGSEAVGPRAYAGSAILRAGAVRFEHDALGRMTLRQKRRPSRRPDTWHYTWDAENRLTSVVTPDGTRWRYRHDPLGRRTAKQRLADDGETVAEEIRFSWDGMTLCEETILQADLGNTVALTWDHRSGVPLSQTERVLGAGTRQEEVDRRFFAIATDLVGTPTELIGEDGTVAWRKRATLWGATAWARSSTAYTPLRFPGQYYDPETGLHYNLFRHYDPETARYLTPDPLGLAPAPNPVTYVRNPHTWSDPLGLSPYPRGERGNPFDNRADAERAAHELAGVRYGEEPIAEWTVTGDRHLKHAPGYIYSSDPAHWGHFRQFETDSGSRVVVEHTHDPAGPHFHAGKPKNDDTRSLVNFGWDNTQIQRPDGTVGYPESMERYAKINKPGGDHHLFYSGG